MSWLTLLAQLNGNAPCFRGDRFFGLPTWYRYLPVEQDEVTGGCKILVNGVDNAYWLIGLAIIDMMLVLVGVVAVGFIIYGGIRYMLSQGEPENTKAAQSTIVNALIGLGVALIGTNVVGFIAARLT